jgi:hypothetical protein
MMGSRLLSFLAVLVLVLIGVMGLLPPVLAQVRRAPGAVPASAPMARPTIATPTQHIHKMWEVGQTVTFQCKDQEGNWGTAPICVETGKPLSFTYGIDGVVNCAWSVKEPAQYELMKSLIARDVSWECRLPMLPDVDFYVPFFIPVWGVVERDHIHVDNHMNFVLHAWTGKIIAVTAYPVRDQFQLASAGGQVTIHGPIKWFRGGTFESFSSPLVRMEGEAAAVDVTTLVILVVIWSLISFGLAALFFLFLYRTFLRPRLVETVLKRKKE